MNEKERNGMKKVLLAGVTGYLGGYIAKKLREGAYTIRAIARNTERLKEKSIEIKLILQNSRGL